MKLKTIATFLTPEDAEVARIALLDEDIEASLENANTVGMVWYYGNATGWVKLQVSEDDEQRARNILTQAAARSEVESPGVACSRCGAELPPGFRVCWSCGADATAESAAKLSDTIAAKSEVEDEAEATHPSDEMAWRAFIAAMLGLFLCPPLFTLYSGWLVLRLAIGSNELSRKGRRYFYGAMLIDVLVCLAVVFLLRIL